jgi:hypothetical protein
VRRGGPKTNLVAASDRACSAAAASINTVYDNALQSGGNVVTVATVPEHDYNAVMSILEKHNPVDIDERTAAYSSLAIGQEINHFVRLKVDQHRAVATTASPCPIIDPEDTRHLHDLNGPGRDRGVAEDLSAVRSGDQKDRRRQSGARQRFDGCSGDPPSESGERRCGLSPDDPVTGDHATPVDKRL